MKRVILTTVIFLGATFAAHADHDVWNNLLTQQRGDYAVNLDVEYCAARVGPTVNGMPTSAATRRCMRSRGWALDHTDVEPWTWRHHHHWHHRYGW